MHFFMHCLIVQKHIMGHCMLNILYLSYPTYKVRKTACQVVPGLDNKTSADQYSCFDSEEKNKTAL